MWDFILAVGEDFHVVHIPAINSILERSDALNLVHPGGLFFLGIRLHTPSYQLDSALTAKVC